ncbi:uncharacterized protein LOC107027458 [Solanum pennellii]|uniref:Uncharacterized protein LOC107027458 n=1 Tax=Solanum pennellii TaxID=28526 RepID=A0ABM1HDZ4_SOLPN|nr:uncharacterized protein LOC107027458 [Solanum pennellii]
MDGGDQFQSSHRKAAVDFVHSNIICRFGIPRTISTNNVANLNSNLMKEVRELFKIVHHNSTPYRSKANGALEVAIKNIKNILRRMVQNTRQWHEKFPFALLGYCTTICTSFGETPYFLVYETKVVIPAEVKSPSIRIIFKAKIEDTEWVKTRLEKPTLIHEKRFTAVCFGHLYQQCFWSALSAKDDSCIQQKGAPKIL